jgi:hypothetical protein
VSESELYKEFVVALFLGNSNAIKKKFDESKE